MPLLTVRQAADHVGVARQTMFAYVKSGRVSATVDPPTGEKRIDIAELLRVFGDRLKTDKTLTVTDNRRLSEKAPATQATVALQIEVERLRAQLEARVTEVGMLRDRVSELKEREAHADQERAKLLALLEQSQRLLTSQVPAPKATKKTKPAR